MKIKKLTGKIIQVIDLSPTAKEIRISLSEPIDFIPGSFVNVFMNIDGEKIRRAYSISSSQKNQNEICLAIRHTPTGKITPLFWKRNMVGETLELMGPLGLNTVDKMNSEKVYLFAFGVGAGVVKLIADYFTEIKKVKKLIIATGSRSEDEILYKEYFDDLANKIEGTSVLHVVTAKTEGSKKPQGFIQDHIGNFDFNDSDVYICGQEVACNDLVGKIKSLNHVGCNFFIEGFH